MPPKKANAKDFWAKKDEAFKLYGRAATRPQVNFRSYLISKRKVNLGLDIRSNKKQGDIILWTMEPSELKIFPTLALDLDEIRRPNSIKKQEIPNWSMVNNEISMAKLLMDVKGSFEIAVDLEANTEHSYTGMTALLQIGTHNHTFLVDPFPLYDDICESLVPVLENPSILKIMFGCDNDITYLNRDFAANLVGVVDVQFVHWEMMKHLRDSLSSNPTEVEEIYSSFPSWFKRATGFKTSSGDSDSRNKFHQATNNRISLSDLAKIYFPSISISPSSATFADWRIRPLENPDLLSYALSDANTLLLIWQRMKKLILQFKIFGRAFTKSIEVIRPLLLKHYIAPTEKSVENRMASMQNFKSLSARHQEKLQMIFQFVVHHAKLIDEPPAEVLTDGEAFQLCKLSIAEPAAVSNIILQRKFPPECINTVTKPIARIINEGRPFFDKIMQPSLKCHSCLGKFTYPHLAWGCVQNYSQAAVAKYMQMPENSTFREKQDSRRRRNWEQKYGKVSCPYLDKK